MILFHVSIIMTAQTNEKDNIEEQIEKGFIETLTENSYSIYSVEKYGEIEFIKSTPYKFSRSFDTKGRMISRFWYNDDGYIDEKNVYKYNDEENSKERVDYDAKGITDKLKIYYDENGHHIKEIKIDIKTGIEKEIISNDIIKYNDDGKLLEWIAHRDDGSIRSKQKNLYFENGVILEYHWIIYGSFAERINYDIEGKKITRYEYVSDGDLKTKQKFKYLPNGNLSKSYLYYPDGTLIRDVSYDEMGNITIEKVYDSYDGKLDYQVTYNYKFEYDNHNNWVKKTEIRKWSDDDRSSTSVKERIIEYY